MTKHLTVLINFKKIIIKYIFLTNLFSQVSYLNQIQPIFDNNCTNCHMSGGAATLDLTSYNGVMAGGVSGLSIIAGDYVNSELYIRITLPQGAPGSMPPNVPLSDNEIDLIAQWIGEGAINLSITDSSLPTNFILGQNYPNPFNPTTKLSYELSYNAHVKLTIHNMLGKEINNLVDANQSSGYKSVQWDATNNQGQPVSSGVYLYKLQVDDFVDTKKMLLLK